MPGFASNYAVKSIFPKMWQFAFLSDTHIERVVQTYELQTGVGVIRTANLGNIRDLPQAVSLALKSLWDPAFSPSVLDGSCQTLTHDSRRRCYVTSNYSSY